MTVARPADVEATLESFSSFLLRSGDGFMEMVSGVAYARDRTRQNESNEACRTPWVAQASQAHRRRAPEAAAAARDGVGPFLAARKAAGAADAPADDEPFGWFVHADDEEVEVAVKLAPPAPPARPEPARSTFTTFFGYGAQMQSCA